MRAPPSEAIISGSGGTDRSNDESWPNTSQAVRASSMRLTGSAPQQWKMPSASGLAAISHMASAHSLARLDVAVMLMSLLSHTPKGSPCDTALSTVVTK